MSSSKKHICFVIPFSYSLYNTATNYSFGGAEVRSSLFAKALAKQDSFEISVIVNNYGQLPVERYDGVTVYPHSGYYDSSHWLTRYRKQLTTYIEPKSGIPYFRVKHFHIYGLYLLIILGLYRSLGELKSWLATSPIYLFDRILPIHKYQIYEDVAADIYCVFGTKPLGSEVAAYCKARNKKFILFGASDRNFTTLNVDDVYKDRDEVSVRATTMIIESADLIIAQTQQQAELINNNFDRNAKIVTNPIDLETAASPHKTGYALWVGKSDEKKNPNLLLSIAKHIPNMSFIMILNNTNQELFDQCVAQCLNNVEIIESVSFSDIEQYFAGATVLINTSPMEGFPNTFLQAGKYKVPILSYQVNPDDYITTWNCGVVANRDDSIMRDTLLRLQDDNIWRDSLGENHYRYVVNKHNLVDKMMELENHFLSLLQ